LIIIVIKNNKEEEEKEEEEEEIKNKQRVSYYIRDIIIIYDICDKYIIIKYEIIIKLHNHFIINTRLNHESLSFGFIT